jgi:hypothetical protein
MRVPLARGKRRARCGEHGGFIAVRACNGVTRGRVGVAAAQHVPLAGAGAAAARPLPAKYGGFIAVRACKGRDAAAWAGGVARALFDRRAPEIDRGPPVSRAR